MWYSGETDEVDVVVLRLDPEQHEEQAVQLAPFVSGSNCGSGRRTPFGRPVVPAV